MMVEEYLGDGVYVRDEEEHVTLYASNGVEITNAVYLEDEVLDAFIRWLKANGKLEDIK